MRDATLQVALAALGLSVVGLLLELRKRDKKNKKIDSSDPPLPKRQASIRRYEALILERGSVGSKDYRVHVLQKDTSQRARELSLWHDVPLVAPSAPSAAPASPRNGPPLFNFVCEIPKCTRKKFEVATDETKCPIKQDEKKGVLREFKKGDIFFNYGCFPRTWEDPRHVSKDTGYPGDNDPLDVCEIGIRQIGTGQVRAVKVLGVLAMIDDDETDWKVGAVASNRCVVHSVMTLSSGRPRAASAVSHGSRLGDDRWAPELNDVDDVERLLPGTISLIREWFRTYKIPDGKPPNKFALEERCMPRAYAHGVIRDTHAAYRDLLASGGHEGLHLPADISSLTGLARDSEIVDRRLPLSPAKATL